MTFFFLNCTLHPSPPLADETTPSGVGSQVISHTNCHMIYCVAFSW